MFSQKKKWHTKPDKDKKEFKIPKRYWLYLVLIIFCIVGVIYILRLPEYQIENIVVENAVLTPEQDIKAIADEYLSYTYFYIVPQSNIWLYPKQKMLVQIKTLPSILGASIYLDKSDTLHIDVREKNNKFLWCNDNGDCFYMTETGYIFASAPKYEGNIFTTFSGQMNGDVLGKYFLTEEKMKNILDFNSKLKELGIEVRSVDVKTEEGVTLTLSSGTKLIVGIDRSLSDTYINIKTLLESKDFLDKSGGIDKIDYIDLRYGKKAFWKARETL
ncbi:MAG: hypothetical protein JWP09_595 [Candidatus Taylorbacteria bacterium]|nr:hypothetical protein [Candidatus Taylorbacteria bacterium]